MKEIARYERRVFLKDHPPVTERVLIASSGEDRTLLAGTVLGVDAGKHDAWTDGKEASCVLAEDVDVPAAGDAYALAYVHAALIAPELTWADGVSATDQKTALAAQREASDIAFLYRLCKERGVNLKVHDGKMILYGAKEYDAKGPSMTIVKRETLFSPSSYSFKENAEGTFKAAEVEHHDPKAHETYTAQVDAGSEPPSGQTLKLNQRVESVAAAIALGNAGLRNANEKADTGSFTILGNPGLVAGITVTMSGFGKFDGKYFVEKAEHKVTGTGGYTTDAEIRRILGY